MSTVTSAASGVSGATNGASGAESALLKSIVMAIPDTVELEPEPISQQWVLSGTPIARSKVVARSRDWTSTVVVWECSAGSFRWHYNQNETIVVTAGEAFLLLEDGTERRFGAGEVGFFPAGTTCSWRVADHIRKVAVLQEPMWRPLGMAVKISKKLLRMAGSGA